MGALDKMSEEAYGDWDEEASNAKQMQVEELMAECMRQQGFEYVPVDWAAMSGDMAVSSEEVDDIPWGTKEFAERLKAASAASAAEASPELIGQFGVGFYACFMVAVLVSSMRSRAM